jgi:ABC-type uncharacterized transport system permease subunit
VKSFTFSLLSLALGFAFSCLVALAIGESPSHLLAVIAVGALGSATNLGYSLFYATPLIMTGLSVSWAFRAGLFNIGAEGQMALGGLTMTWVALSFPAAPPIFVISVSILAAFLVSGLWGAIAGWMKAYRGTHEVLTTILLNYVAYGLLSFCISFPLRNLETQSPESRSINSAFKLWDISGIGGQSPLNVTFLFFIAVSLLGAFVVQRTVFGFRTRMVGEAPGTAQSSAISIKFYTVASMFIAGGFAGLAGINDIFGYSLKLKEGFTAGAGFMGIAVALLGRNNVFGVIISSLLFGALQKGSLELDIEMDKVTRDMAVVIQSFVIFSVVSEKGLTQLVRWLRSKRGSHV